MIKRKAEAKAPDIRASKYWDPTGGSAPIPVEWTENVGPNRRDLEEGMEVRFRKGGETYRVDSVNIAGAIVTPISAPIATVIGIDGAVRFKGTRASQRIAIRSEIEYRAGRPMEWGGLDSEDYDVLSSSGQAGNHEGKENEMAIKRRKVKMPGGKGKAKATGNGKSKAKREATLDCLCGCGGKTASYFVPGHDARFKGWLGKIAKGTSKPSELLPEQLRKSLGPWKDKGDGQIPSRSYKELREL